MKTIWHENPAPKPISERAFKGLRINYVQRHKHEHREVNEKAQALNALAIRGRQLMRRPHKMMIIFLYSINYINA